MSAPLANGGQTWALFCATGLDCRSISLTADAATNLLDAIARVERTSDFDLYQSQVVDALIELGATGTPKPSKKLRNARHAALWARAQEAGQAAAEACTPTPMTVVERAHPLDDTSPVTRVYEPVADGVCGFASVVVRPGNSSFARWLKDYAGGRKSYYGGIAVSVNGYRQSYERKSAHAQAAADVLRAEGINAMCESRLD